MLFERFRTRPAPKPRREPTIKIEKSDRTAPALAPSDLARVGQNYQALREARAAEEGVKPVTAALILVACGLVAMSHGAWAQATDTTCGGAYAVQTGDTLYRIADRVYGDGTRYQAIVAANAPVLTSTTLLEVGEKLLVPCLDGSGPQTRDQAVALGLVEPLDGAPAVLSAPALAPASAPAPAVRADAPVEPPTPVLAVSGPEFSPFSGPELPAGGLIPALVARALEVSGGEIDLAFARYPSERLEMLSPGGGKDLGYPWFRPDCDAGAELDPVTRRLCDEFAFSDPVYAIPVGVYVRRGDALAGAETLADLAGKRLCRPAGHFTFDLEQAGLTGTAATIDLRSDAEACFRALAEGRTDVVTMARHPVAPILRRLRLVEAVEEAPELAANRTLHVIAAKANPAALEFVDQINQGMEELRTSGAWFEAVLAHLARGDALVN